MTPPTTIPNALAVVRTALQTALAPLVPSFAGAPACYFKQAVQGTAAALLGGDLAALLIYQFQDGGGQGVDYFGAQDWTGLVTIKACAPTQAAAEALLFSVPAALVSLAQPTLYHIHASHIRPLDLPTVDDIVTVALVYRINLSKE